MNIHDLARDFLSIRPGLKYTDPQKRAVFEFADYVLKQQRQSSQPAQASLCPHGKFSPDVCLECGASSEAPSR